MMHRCTYPALAALVFGLNAFSQPYFSRTYSGFGLNRATITPDSGLVLSGGGTSTYAGTSLLRVDRAGTPMWKTSYTLIGYPVKIRDVAWIGDSSYILVGYAGTEWTTNNWMVQQVVGSTGEVSWGGISTGNGYSEDTADRLNRAERAPDGSAVMCGVHLVLNLAGVYGPGYALRVGHEAGSYSASFVSQGDPFGVIEDVAPTSDGGFVSIGFCGSNTIAYKVSASDTLLWSRRVLYNWSDIALMHTVEGEAGSTYMATEAGGGFFRLIRLDPDGAVSWCKKFQMPSEGKPTGLVRFPNGDLWISGTGWLMACSPIGDVIWAHDIPHTILDMEGVPEADGVFLIGRDGNNGWLMRTDLTGQVPGCPETSFVPTVTSETLVSEEYDEPNSWNPLSGYEVNVTSGSVPSAGTECLATAVLAARTDQRALRAFPSPFTDQLTLELPFSHDRVELIDGRGAICRAMSTNNEPSIVLGREDLPPGLYLLRVMKAGLSVAAQPVIAE